jgi:hypothetical protein
MDDSVNPVILENVCNPLRVGEIGFDQRTPSNGPVVTAGEIVQDYRKVPGLSQLFGDVAPDVACTSGDKYSQLVSTPL